MICWRYTSLCTANSSVFLRFFSTLLIVGFGALAWGTTLPPVESIHQQELFQWHDKEENGWQPWQESQDIPVSPLGLTSRSMTHEVHGYHPYWSGNAYTSYDWSLITTIAFFSLEMSPYGTITNDHGWPWTELVSMAHDNGTRVIVTVTNFYSPDIQTLLTTPAYRAAAISNIVAAVQLGGADGVNIDFEYITAAARASFVTFIADLNVALHEILDDPYLSVATPAVDWNGSYDYAALAEHCNHLMIMAYSYHWSGSTTTGPVAPLAGWGTYNVTWTIDDYLFWGVAPSSILLGVPYYGRHWPTSGPEPAAPTTGTGAGITFAEAQPQGTTHGLLWDDPGQTPWYRYETDQWQQVWFDNEVSLGAKYDFVKNESLAGIGIWALSYDGARPELWAALSSAFHESTPVPYTTPNLTILSPTPNPASHQTTLNFTLSHPTNLAIKIYDLRGRQIATLTTGLHASGPGSITWHAPNVPTGTYLIKYTTPQSSFLKRITLVR
jgi:spore germination protein YaaH